jgi:hypothetical protein
VTVKEIKKSVEKMRKLSKEIASSKKKSREFLIEAGIYTPTGQLAKPYR